LSDAILDTLHRIEAIENKHRRAALWRALMVQSIRDGFSFDQFKAIMNLPITRQCFQDEVENENS
jgi:hypothetical protein